MPVEFEDPHYIRASEDMYQSYIFDTENRLCFPTNHRTKAKWEALHEVFPDLVRGRAFMDVGAAQGFFCWKALECGAQWVYGLEKREDYWRPVYEALAHAERLPVFWLHGSFPEDLKYKRADIVLMLSLSHHLARAHMDFDHQLRELALATERTLLVEYISPDDGVIMNIICRIDIPVHYLHVVSIFLQTSGDGSPYQSGPSND